MGPYLLNTYNIYYSEIRLQWRLQFCNHGTLQKGYPRNPLRMNELAAISQIKKKVKQIISLASPMPANIIHYTLALFTTLKPCIFYPALTRTYYTVTL